MERPSRSDARLPYEEEEKRAEETREYFDGIAPKRHTKPSRSDYSSQYTDALQFSDGQNPEFLKFQDLQNKDSQKLMYKGSAEAPEEYVETEYYKDLNCIDKQHHTTGTGFIKVENANKNYFGLAPDNGGSGSHGSCKGNPATNEWYPVADTVIPSTDKPNRSEI